MVLVVVAGGPVTLDSVMANVQAILWTGYHSATSGAVIADILFGKTNPSGKLPVTFPRSAGHLPCYYYQKPTGAFKEYLFEDSSPLFPFGLGSVIRPSTVALPAYRHAKRQRVRIYRSPSS